MKMSGYRGRWAFIDLTDRTVRVEPADPASARDYVGGRGLQARLLADHLERTGPLADPLAPGNRIVIGTAALNDTAVATAGRGSCSFVGTMARSPQPAAWVPGHKPLSGLVTHSSAGHTSVCEWP
jgi:aldehyde:ferredoxin oxidoreductase